MTINRLSLSPSVKKWWPLLPILLLAILFRIGDLPLAKGTIDYRGNGIWIQMTMQYGLFASYSTHRVTYLPLHTTLMYILGLIQTSRGLPIDPYEPGLFLMLKILPVVCDLITIGVVYAWLRDRRFLRWIIPIWLAILPGLIIVSAWRGQVDSLVTMFNICALISLNRDRPRLSWMFWGLALLSKVQGVLIGPLLFVLTLRRFGRRELAICLGVFGLTCIVPQIPFIIGSGKAYFESLLPAVDGVTTVHSLNFWYLANPIAPAMPSQNLPIWGPLTARYAGLIIVGTFELLVLVHAWRHADKRYEFVWAASFELAFWVFLTQMFERWLYYAAALFPMAVVQEPQLLLVALGVTYTFTLNNISIWTGKGFTNLGDWLGQFLWLGKFYSLAALLNVAMVFDTLRILIKGRGPYKWFFEFVRLANVAIAITLMLFIAHDTLSYYPTGTWLTNNVADSTRIATESVQVTHYVNDVKPKEGYWNWILTPNIETQNISQWQSTGVQFLVIDESAIPTENFDTRINRLVDQGGTLLYESGSLLRFNSRQAVLWTFRPQIQTNLIFENSLRLIGYDVTQDGERRSLSFYWQVERTIPVDFNIFLHLLDPATKQLVEQADTAVGQSTHPTSTWRLHEIVVDHYVLPNNPDNKQYTLQVGIYQFSNGQRAVIKDQTGHDQGDYFEVSMK